MQKHTDTAIAKYGSTMTPLSPNNGTTITKYGPIKMPRDLQENLKSQELLRPYAA